MTPELPAPIPFYFGPPARRLFGWYHPARPSNTPTLPAVVLCPPIGYEALCTHTTYSYLAERLADSGYPALRFDYDGTGDSFGDDDDPERVQSWIASIGFAIDVLRVRSERPEIALFGIRLGATLATVAAAERGDVSRLILWAACRDGRSYLREMRALHAARRPATEESPEVSATEALPYEEAAGFYFTTPTLNDLAALNACSIEHIPAPQALLIGRDDIPNETRLGKHLTSLGTAVTTVAWPGYAALMRDPQDTEIPIDAIEQIVEWVGKPALSTTPAVVPQPTQPPDITTHLHAATYEEEPFRSGSDSRVFGILTLPPCDMPCNRPAVLLLTVGANPHVGPNRMYVPLARDLAASGFPVLRLDVPGVGDSAHGSTSARDCIYSPAAAESIRATIDHLRLTRLMDRFVLVGLCSGAYNAFKVTTDELQVVGQVLINPQTFEWNEGDSLEVRMSQSYKPTGFYMRSLRDPETLKRILTRQVDLRGVAGILWKRLGERVRLSANAVATAAIQRRKYETPVRWEFLKISRRGTQTLFLFAEYDFGIELMAMHLGVNREKPNGLLNVQAEVITDADHTFTPKAARDQLLVRIEEYITQTFAPASLASPRPKV